MSNSQGMQLPLDVIEDMCKDAGVADLAEIIDDYDKICELLQTGSICIKIGEEKVYVTIQCEKAPDDAEVFEG